VDKKIEKKFWYNKKQKKIEDFTNKIVKFFELI
jgi:hypothetical protein